MELWFLAADCIVLPYERIYQSGVALQAMSRKVPVLMSDLPAHAEWHHEGADATLFQAGDSVDLALKLQWMQHNLVEIAQRADRAYQHLVKYHDWKILASGIVNLSAVG
jgi:glycosyltransferase involved in cell wall biosynthesis